MAYDVHRNAIYENGDIGSVVCVEASEKYLICLAAALVLSNEKARNESKYIAGRRSWPKLEVFLPNRLLRGCRNRLFPPNVDFNRLG